MAGMTALAEEDRRWTRADAPSVTAVSSFRAALAPAHLVRRRVRSTAERVGTHDQEHRSFAATGSGRDEAGFGQPGRLRSRLAAGVGDARGRQRAESELSERSVGACPAEPARAQEGRLCFEGAESRLGPGV